MPSTSSKVLQGSAAKAGILFAQTNRAKVRSITLAGVDTAGRSSFTTPPLFESGFGHTLATQVPGINWITLAWFRSKAARGFTAGENKINFRFIDPECARGY